MKTKKEVITFKDANSVKYTVEGGRLTQVLGSGHNFYVRISDLKKIYQSGLKKYAFYATGEVAIRCLDCQKEGQDIYDHVDVELFETSIIVGCATFKNMAVTKLYDILGKK